MAAIINVNSSKFSMRWREPYISEGVNRNRAVVKRGILRGFRAEAVGVNSQVILRVDEVLKDSVANVIGRDLSAAEEFFLTYRESGDVTVGLNGADDSQGHPIVGDTEYAICLVPDYQRDQETTLQIQAVKDTDYYSALTDGALTVCFVRTAAATTSALAEVFLAGSADARAAKYFGASAAWASDDLMVEFITDAFNGGVVGGKQVELLYDLRPDLLKRFEDYVVYAAGLGDDFDVLEGLATLDAIDLMRGSPMASYFSHDDTEYAANLFTFSDGPTGQPQVAIGLGAMTATWDQTPTVISAVDPAIYNNVMGAFYPCKPGDKFIVQLWIKGDITNNATFREEIANQTGLGAFWGNEWRGGMAALASEDLEKFNGGVGNFQFATSWKLYRVEVTCPVNASGEYPLWFAPLWKLTQVGEGRIWMAGHKVWKVRDVRASSTTGYGQQENALGANASTAGEQSHYTAQAPLRGSVVAIHPFGFKQPSFAGPTPWDLVDYDDVKPHLMMSILGNALEVIISQAPNNASVLAMAPPKYLVSTEYQDPSSPGTEGDPVFDLEMSLGYGAFGVPQLPGHLSALNRAKFLVPTGSLEVSTDQPNGIDEILASGGIVVRIEPDAGLNDYIDPRIILDDWTIASPPYPDDPRFVVRENGSVESNLDIVMGVYGLPLQAASYYGGAVRLRSMLTTIVTGGKIGEIVVTGDDPNTNPLAPLPAAAGKGYEGARQLFVARRDWDTDDMSAYWTLDLSDGSRATPNHADPGRSAEPLMRVLDITTLGAGSGQTARTDFVLTVDDQAHGDIPDQAEINVTGRALDSAGASFERGTIKFTRGQATGNTRKSVLKVYVQESALGTSLKGRLGIDDTGFIAFGLGADMDARASKLGSDSVPQQAVGTETASVQMYGLPEWTNAAVAAFCLADASGYILVKLVEEMEWDALGAWDGADVKQPIVYNTVNNRFERNVSFPGLQLGTSFPTDSDAAHVNVVLTADGLINGGNYPAQMGTVPNGGTIGHLGVSKSNSSEFTTAGGGSVSLGGAWTQPGDYVELFVKAALAGVVTINASGTGTIYFGAAGQASVATGATPQGYMIALRCIVGGSNSEWVVVSTIGAWT